MNGKLKSLLVLILFIALCFAVSAIGAFFTASSIASWYSTLRKPSWNPPGWVFGPVWSVLYLMIAFSGWLAWKKRGFKPAVNAWALFLAQLTLNAVWSPLFFGLQSAWAGLLVIVPLWTTNSGHAYAFLENFSPGRAFAVALLAVGELRRRAQFHDLENELVKAQDAGWAKKAAISTDRKGNFFLCKHLRCSLIPSGTFLLLCRCGQPGEYQTTLAAVPDSDAFACRDGRGYPNRIPFSSARNSHPLAHGNYRLGTTAPLCGRTAQRPLSNLDPRTHLCRPARSMLDARFCTL